MAVLDNNKEGRTMIYPDGKTVSIGDLIWWNEGTKKGRVSLIVDTDEIRSEWGLDENGIFISANHMNSEMTSDVFYAEKDFEDEGIAKYD